MPIGSWNHWNRLLKTNKLLEDKTLSDYRKYECAVCGWIYDEEKGDPDSGLAPGTRYEDIPDDWLCPDCGVDKTFFELVS